MHPLGTAESRVSVPPDAVLDCILAYHRARLSSMNRPTNMRFSLTCGPVRLLCLALWALALMACASGGSAGDACSTDEECEGSCVDGICGATDASVLPDALDIEDLDDGDDRNDVDATPDIAPIDTGRDVDTTPDVNLEGGFGWPCVEDVECDSGYCVDAGDGERLCTVLCVDTCPAEDWDCRLVVASGGDVERICIPRIDVTCDPCDTDTECGAFTDLCIELEDGRFCGSDCSDRPCAEGFECVEETRAVEDGVETYEQCVPITGFCGDCVDRDGDGFGEGDGCLGTDCRDDLDYVYEGAAELCDELDNDCNDAIDESFDLLSEAENCGTCGTVCSAPRATTACLDGGCIIRSCVEGFFDVNNDIVDGCEFACELTNEGVEICDDLDNDCNGLADDPFDLDTDVLNCGRCGSACNDANATMECLLGECGVSACDEGWVDANLDASDGCEYQCTPTEDPTEVCDLFDNDCDGVVDNDIDFATNLDHCGGCNIVCAADDAENACVSGECRIVECVRDRYDIDLVYENGCEYSCVFQGATEVCDSVDQNCDGQIDEGFALLTDETNCGACGLICDLELAEEICIDGGCEIANCLGGSADCDTVASNGCEVDLDSDEDNCGGCGDMCALPGAFSRCDAGECEVFGCQGTQQDCDLQPVNGCESDRLTDPNNCGFCGRNCAAQNADTTCSTGSCEILACEPEYRDCDLQPTTGCETRVIDNDIHCGGCFNSCSLLGGDARCVGTSCVISACPLGTGDCNGDFGDGCETDTTVSLENCGACGRVCEGDQVETAECVEGDCGVVTCEEGWDNCNTQFLDGCEQDIYSDVANCGGCDTPCSPAGATGICDTGACVWDDCQDGFYDIDGEASNGCEYACTFLSDIDWPDADDVDANCDGIDGDIDAAVFVAPPPFGAPAGPGTMGAPFATIAGATAFALGNGRTQVLVAEGVYDESVTLRSGVSLYGSYIPASPVWGRAALSEAVSVFGTGTVGLSANGVNNATVVARFRIESDNATDDGESTYGVHIRNSSGVTLEGNLVVAGNGANGSPGASSTVGRGGLDGGDAGNGCDGCSGGGAAGGRGTGYCSNTGGLGGRGGYGNSRGGSGEPGSGVLGGSGSTGGGGNGGTCGFSCNRGGTGGTGGGGARGGNGQNGFGGNGNGSVVGDFWVGASGTSGSVGSTGGGGGAGAGGGGSDCCIDDRGAGGGGGGGGGCGGTGGGGGNPGGGSFGVFAVNGTVIMTDNDVRAGAGGRGGNGITGGTGGAIGSGGSGGGPADDGGRGGNGGSGGGGGNGGCGGGGGGGAAFAVYRQSSSVLDLASNDLTSLAGGAGGAGCAFNGSTGANGDIR
jgi:hypothetical protein